MLKRALALIVFISLVCSLFSCASVKDFSFAEFKITLDSDFYEGEKSENYNLVLSNGFVSVGIARFSFVNAGFEGILSAEKFAEHIGAQTGKASEIFLYGDIPYYTYYETVDGQELYCSATFARSKYAYFLILYTTARENETEWADRFLEYTKTVKFTA